MLFKSPCCLRSDSCSILCLQYPDDGDMDESKGPLRKINLPTMHMWDVFVALRLLDFLAWHFKWEKTQFFLFGTLFLRLTTFLGLVMG